MSVDYSQTAINDRLLGVVTAIDDGGGPGTLLLQTSGSVTLATIVLADPCGTVNGGVLSLTCPLYATASATGSAAVGIVQDSNGNTMIFGLTVGIPLSGSDILLTNGANSTLITSGQVVQLLSAQIQGS